MGNQKETWSEFSSGGEAESWNPFSSGGSSESWGAFSPGGESEIWWERLNLLVLETGDALLLENDIGIKLEGTV